MSGGGRLVALSLAAVVLNAGCGAGWPGIAETRVPVTSVEQVSPTPRPTEVPGPPSATLTALNGDAVPGGLGTFTWDGLVSDAPWIVPPPAGAVTGAGPFTVAFAPAMPVERWTAKWAKVTTGDAGTPADGGGGTGSPVRIEPPPAPGSWGLQVHAWFGPGRHATWYWRVEVRP